MTTKVMVCKPAELQAIVGQGIAPWHAALTDSDLVAVTNAPITVQLILLFWPVVCTTLLSRSLVNEVASDWTCQNAEAKSPDNDGCEGVFGFDHGLSPCVWCPSPQGAITGPGFAPGHPLKRISWLNSCCLHTNPCGSGALALANRAASTE